MGKGYLRTHKQRSGKPASCAAGLLGMALLCFPLASAAGRLGVDTQDGIVEIAAGVGMQDLTPLAPPSLYAPVVIVQAPKTQPGTLLAAVGGVTVERTIGVCQLIENPAIPPGTAANALGPITSAWGYLQRIEKLTAKQLPDEMFLSAKATLLQAPEHGELRKGGGEDSYRYFPTPGYFGADRATVLVEMGNYKVKVVIHLKVLPRSEIGGRMYENKNNCPKGELWKISLSSDAPSTLRYSFTALAA